MKRLFCILFCLFLLGCQQDNGDKPDNMIPQRKMVRILADIHTAEAVIEQNIPYPDTALMVFNKQQAEILKKHGVEQEDFKRTYRYYLNNIREMDKLYEIVVDTLSVRESREQAAQSTQGQDQRGQEQAREQARDLLVPPPVD